jgi:glucose/arabinose dehydrogenase
MKLWTGLLAGAALAIMGASAMAQNAPQPAPGETPPARQRPAGPPPMPTLGDGPWDIQSWDAKLHVEVVSKGLDHPWGMAFLPDGGILVTERPGRLRLIRNGVLDPQPIAGLPPIYATGIAGLTDIVLDPNFASNGLIYMSYSKAAPDTPPGTNPAQTEATLAVMRAKWDGAHQLTDVKDIFIADAWYGKPPLPPKCCGQGPASGSFGGRMAFDGEGHLFVTSGDRNFGEKVQDPSNHFGKILRINLDGTPVRDNPFVGRAGYKPEIWSTGHRNQLGLFYDAPTGQLWESEFGPRGGDEINLITKGGNYGWLDVTQGHHYNGEATHKGIRGVAGYIDPVWAFPPSGNPGNVAIYRGDLFPEWQGDLLVVNMSRPPALIRMKLSPEGHVTASETLLTNLNQRLRDVRVGPDGAIYILTDETAGALLKITPGS